MGRMLDKGTPRSFAFLAHPQRQQSKLEQFKKVLVDHDFALVVPDGGSCLRSAIRDFFGKISESVYTVQPDNTLVVLHFAGTAYTKDGELYLSSADLAAGADASAEPLCQPPPACPGSTATSLAAAANTATMSVPRTDVSVDEVIQLSLQSRARVVLLLDAPLRSFSSSSGGSGIAEPAMTEAAAGDDCVSVSDQNKQQPQRAASGTPEWPQCLIQRACRHIKARDRSNLLFSLIVGNACARDESLLYTAEIQQVLFDETSSVIDSLSKANLRVASLTSGASSMEGGDAAGMCLLLCAGNTVSDAAADDCQVPHFSAVQLSYFQQPLCCSITPETAAGTRALSDTVQDDQQECDQRRLFMDIAHFVQPDLPLESVMELCLSIGYDSIENQHQLKVALQQLQQEGFLVCSVQDGQQRIAARPELGMAAAKMWAAPGSKTPYLCINSSHFQSLRESFTLPDNLERLRLDGLGQGNRPGFQDVLPSFLQNLLQSNLQSNIQRCKLLRVLSLRSVEVPVALGIGDLPKLRLLDMESSTCSVFPEQLSSCTSLRALLASGTLTASGQQLPTCIASLRQLQVLQLASNNFAAMLPSKWSALRGLRHLQLGSNQLVGKLPIQWTGLTNLTLLDLHSNKLRGNLPQSWTRLVGLQVLLLGDNQLSGNLPIGLSALSSLRCLELAKNSVFTGALPDCGNMLQLSRLDVSKNKLKGQLPSTQCSWSTLVHLNLSSNKFSGQLPVVWDQLRQLQHLVLDKNQLQGDLPEQWSGLVELKQISISNNNLSGGLPATWSALQNLEKINLLNNELDGELPHQWSALTKLTALSLGRNKLSGSLPAKWSNLLQLKQLSLKRNKLSGELPESWSMLTSLRELRLNNNFLAGALPSSWGRGMLMLTTVKIQHNYLHGPVPDSWNGLHLEQHQPLVELGLERTVAAVKETLAKGLTAAALPRHKRQKVAIHTVEVMLKHQIPGPNTLCGVIKRGADSVAGSFKELARI